MLIILVAASVGALVVTGWAVWRAVTDRPIVGRQLWAMAATEAGVLAACVAAGLGQARGHDVADPVTLWGYLIVALMVLPAAVAWGFADRSRWSSAILGVAGLALLVMLVRVWQLWQA